MMYYFFIYFLFYIGKELKGTVAPHFVLPPLFHVYRLFIRPF